MQPVSQTSTLNSSHYFIYTIQESSWRDQPYLVGYQNHGKPSLKKDFGSNNLVMKAPRVKFWSNSYLVEFANVCPDSGADSSIMSYHKFCELTESSECDFVTTQKSISASGPSDGHSLDIIGCVEMPIILQAQRPVRIEYPDECCEENGKAIKFYICKNLSCDAIISWKDMIFLGIKLNTQNENVHFAQHNTVQYFDESEPPITVQERPNSSQNEQNWHFEPESTVESQKSSKFDKIQEKSQNQNLAHFQSTAVQTSSEMQNIAEISNLQASQGSENFDSEENYQSVQNSPKFVKIQQNSNFSSSNPTATVDTVNTGKQAT